MFRLFNIISQFTDIDPRIHELQKDIEFYQFIFWGSMVVVIILALIVFIQRITLNKIRSGSDKPLLKTKLLKRIKKKSKPDNNKPKNQIVSPGKLPDPGLIFKYSLAKENVLEKLITIGQLNGNIKTYSTEILDDHMSIFIRIIENRKEKDIYNLPDRITEEYQLDLRRDGKILIYYPGLKGFREMGSRERIYIKEEPDVAGDPTFPSIDAKQPIRLRIGDRLNQDGKFINGFFEFHLFSQDYEVKTKTNIVKIEKNFLLRLYKIYPGYDTGTPTDDGLYPMIDPFTTG